MALKISRDSVYLARASLLATSGFSETKLLVMVSCRAQTESLWQLASPTGFKACGAPAGKNPKRYIARVVHCQYDRTRARPLIQEATLAGCTVKPLLIINVRISPVYQPRRTGFSKDFDESCRDGRSAWLPRRPGLDRQVLSRRFRILHRAPSPAGEVDAGRRRSGQYGIGIRQAGDQDTVLGEFPENPVDVDSS